MSPRGAWGRPGVVYRSVCSRYDAAVTHDFQSTRGQGLLGPSQGVEHYLS